MNNRRNELLLVSAKEYCKCIVEGKTIRYNQKNVMPNGSFTTWTTIGSANVINGHKYLIHNVYSRPSNDAYGDTDYQVYLDGLLVEGYLYCVNVEKDWIMTCTAQTGTMYFLSATYDNFAGEVFYQIMVIDLTELGLDNITNANEFYQTDLGKYIAKGYYLSASDNAFLNANAPIHFKGVNLWNEQWKNGYYATGTKTFVSNDSWICSKNEIKVNPNTRYFFKCAYYNVIYFFKDDTYIDSVICTDNGFTTPYNCNNILFMTNIATYNHDICISENKFVDNLTQGTLSGFANTTPRQFEEGKYYAGLTDNNYYYASYISNLSVDGGKIAFQTSSGGYGVGIPFKAHPNKTYYLDYICSITEDRMHASFFDKDGNYLSYASTTNNLVTTPANCYWIVLVLRPTENTYAVYNDIVVKESIYQKYCGNETYYEPLTYNQLVLNGNFASTDNWSLNGCTLSVLNNVGTLTITENNASNGIETGIQLGGSSHKYALVYKAYASRITKVWFKLGGSSIAGIEEYIYTTERQFKFIFTSSYNSTETLRMFVNTNDLFLQNGDKVYLSNFMVIDLTNLYGAGNEPTTVNELNETDLGKAIDNGEYLPYSVSNNTYYVGGWDMYKGCVWKSWNGQLTKTMSLINLDNLSWTAEDFGMVAQLPSNFKTFEGNELASVIAEKYETAKYYDEIQDSICIADVYGYGYSVVIRYGNAQPSGFALFELATPTTENVTTRMVSRRTVSVESNNGVDLDFTKE